MHRFALPFFLGCLMSVPALAQTYFQPDAYGYDTPVGGTMFVYRDPVSQHIRVGIMDFQSWNNDTIGTTSHVSQRQSDSYSNPPQSCNSTTFGTSSYAPQGESDSSIAPRQSWHGSGNTRYQRFPKYGRYPQMYYGGSYQY